MKAALSYTLTTYNKLPYLKVTLPLLIAACGKDEEIIIVDGGSTDGTQKFLQDLFEQKKIHGYLSEKDSGEAHGTNKAILMSKGELIKIITDDDVFDYDVIKQCRLFMEQNPIIDILGFDGLGCRISKEPKFEKSNFINGFHKWQEDRTPFLFCGLSFMIRRSSLSYLGLLSTAYKIIDMEYSIRVSALKSHIAFYTGLGFLNIVNPDSNSQKYYGSIRNEQKTLARIYPAIKNSFRMGGSILILKEKLQVFRKQKPNMPVTEPDKQFKEYENIARQGLEQLKINSNGQNKFLT